ncbi:acyl-CoA dehydrogenase family protein [Shimia haliotis]|uniref:Acyl-CoA dehydrogenase n=1 Tax=Shimia haliotis TaxID=1280847 RepID=A0A1I4CNS0_9RHOB|nr:acyl-CoA dehydrogenase family protein [Shimia haliotis]SFK81581.1 Acyl-CoA dehydrogenase [Shimia haliotis]
MDFNLTEDRQMLADTLNRFLGEQYPVEHRIKVAYDAPYHDPTLWDQLVELGALYALAPEDAGGMGGTGFDISVLFEALGKTLTPEPVLGALMALRLLTAAGADQEALLTGATKYAVGITEIDAPYELGQIATVATAKGDGFALSGRKSTVYGGQAADVVLVAAKHGGGLGVFAVSASDANITSYGMMDGGGAAEVLLDDAPATLLLADAGAALEDAINAGIVAICAEAVGAMEVTHATTVEYFKQRKQFGVPIGKFQVLQHRAVDMLTEIEQARSIVIKAAAELGGDEASKYASMAKNLIGRAARLVAEESIQMHGGIAMTWEYAVSHYAKRLIMLDAQLGDTDYHLTQVIKSYTA